MRTAIEFGEITKTFGGTVALDSVSLSVEEGECHEYKFVIDVTGYEPPLPA